MVKARNIPNMKNYLSILISSFLLLIAVTAHAQEYGRTVAAKEVIKNGVPVVKTYETKSIKNLKVSNKHGYVNVAVWPEESIEIRVVVDIQTKSETELEEILSLIELKGRTYSNTVDFKTVFLEDFYSNYPFTINYDIKVPAHINLNINNSIGDVKIVNSEGALSLRHSYGNLELKNIGKEQTHSLHLSFVEGMVDSIGTINSNFSNCTLNIANSNNISGDTKYSMTSISNAKSIHLNTFTDRLIVTQTDSVTVKGSQFIGKVDQLNTYAFCELDKGQLLLNANASIKELTLSNKQLNTTIILPAEVSYYINGEVSNGSFTHPDAKSLQLFNEEDNVTFSGKIGTSTQQPANLTLFVKDASLTIKN